MQTVGPAQRILQGLRRPGSVRGLDLMEASGLEPGDQARSMRGVLEGPALHPFLSRELRIQGADLLGGPGSRVQVAELGVGRREPDVGGDVVTVLGRGDQEGIEGLLAATLQVVPASGMDLVEQARCRV